MYSDMSTSYHLKSNQSKILFDVINGVDDLRRKMDDISWRENRDKRRHDIDCYSGGVDDRIDLIVGKVWELIEGGSESEINN